MSTHKVTIARHAKAAAYSPGTDAQRPLTDEGRAQAQELGRRLADSLRSVDTVFVSPAVRAQQTWENMAQGAGLTPEMMPRVQTDEVIYSGSPMQIMEAVRFGSTGTSSLVVGHEPTVSATAVLLVKEGQATEVENGMPTGSAVVVEWDRNWKEWHSHCAAVADFIHVRHNDIPPLPFTNPLA
ncbi:SixA phosphatase family protein [Actinomyces minihominis]|uniref:SixA phosphatase family protein n=1 Tax=Actinomyces minihominis TaxID=2002838 RepID=UPI000C06CDB8|nr:histidine phosphatase family protein [Actinomyces minihominis]